MPRRTATGWRKTTTGCCFSATAGEGEWVFRWLLITAEENREKEEGLPERAAKFCTRRKAAKRRRKAANGGLSRQSVGNRLGSRRKLNSQARIGCCRREKEERPDLGFYAGILAKKKRRGAGALFKIPIYIITLRK